MTLEQIRPLNYIDARASLFPSKLKETLASMYCFCRLCPSHLTEEKRNHFSHPAACFCTESDKIERTSYRQIEDSNVFYEPPELCRTVIFVWFSCRPRLLGVRDCASDSCAGFKRYSNDDSHVILTPTGMPTTQRKREFPAQQPCLRSFRCSPTFWLSVCHQCQCRYRGFDCETEFLDNSQTPR